MTASCDCVTKNLSTPGEILKTMYTAAPITIGVSRTDFSHDYTHKQTHKVQLGFGCLGFNLRRDLDLNARATSGCECAL